MKIRAPNDWKPGDERMYSFSRSSGLPPGYFHRHTRGRKFWIALALAVVVFAVIA